MQVKDLMVENFGMIKEMWTEDSISFELEQYTGTQFLLCNWVIVFVEKMEMENEQSSCRYKKNDNRKMSVPVLGFIRANLNFPSEKGFVQQ